MLVKGSHDNQTVQSHCNQQLMALFLKDDRNLALSF